jgi:hypothetical protein
VLWPLATGLAFCALAYGQAWCTGTTRPALLFGLLGIIFLAATVVNMVTAPRDP